MTDLIVTREVGADGRGGRYVIRLGPARADLTYRCAGPGRIVAEHTVVPDAFRGIGAGLTRVRRMVADARAEGGRILPVCSCVAAVRGKHPDLGDAFDD